MAITQTTLESVLPGATARSIAPAPISQDGKTLSVRVASLSFSAPPVLDTINGELGGVRGGADEQCAPVGLQVVHTVGHGDAISGGAEVMVVDEHRPTLPCGSLILEGANEFLLLRVDADDRQVLGGKALPQVGDSGELGISVRVPTAGELLVIDTKREAHLLEQAGDRTVTDLDAKGLECRGDLGRGPTSPFQPAHRVARRLVLHDLFDPRDHVRRFFP
jgi:hypothetical protein